ncbi:hypothetical protein DF105_00875 [Burkholderia stagnalis]|uniref:hypothetical protein n=1 Tax=Burkholderia stagnalis TaxID=1503054 RepID=UPI000757C3AC|nr:hypothetical protein [Burkholderia stagnalis]KVN08202.1 hypothetical protein WT09_30735 [Burkholderia stagnalis]RQS15521.1 hypothetical protein DIE07_03580 [Burkholderia sp. Bp9002]RQZ08890.1 hypothetical protein DF105_00875 [Burkholderia stagnalis]
MGNEIDPIEFGRVLARLDEQDRQIAEMSQDIKRLLAMANQGRGGLLMLTSIGAIVGGTLTWLVQHIPFSR